MFLLLLPFLHLQNTHTHTHVFKAVGPYFGSGNIKSSYSAYIHQTYDGLYLKDIQGRKFQCVVACKHLANLVNVSELIVELQSAEFLTITRSLQPH